MRDHGAALAALEDFVQSLESLVEKHQAALCGDPLPTSAAQCDQCRSSDNGLQTVTVARGEAVMTELWCTACRGEAPLVRLPGPRRPDVHE